MGAIAITGSLNAGPTGGGDSFPSSQFLVALALRAGASTSYGVATGVLTRVLASPSAFVALDGVGPTSTVTQGTVLYLRTDGACVLRLTTDDGSNGTEVVEVPVHGLVLVEFPATRPLELLEIKGSARLEYLVAGAS